MNIGFGAGPWPVLPSCHSRPSTLRKTGSKAGDVIQKLESKLKISAPSLKLTSKLISFRFFSSWIQFQCPGPVGAKVAGGVCLDFRQEKNSWKRKDCSGSSSASMCL